MFKKSNKLEGVCYDIRGPVLKQAKEMEDQVAASLKDGQINRSNYDGSLAKLRRMMEEKENA